MGDLGFCTTVDIINVTRNGLLSDIPADIGMPYGLIRFLHNKPFIFSSASLQCFFQYIDIGRITDFVPAFLIFYTLYFFLYTPKKKLVYSVFLGLCVLFILDPFKWDLGLKINLYKRLYYLLAIFGGSIFSYRFLRTKKEIHRTSSKNV